jgi:Tfp pilus assembly protein PilF
LAFHSNTSQIEPILKQQKPGKPPMKKNSSAVRLPGLCLLASLATLALPVNSPALAQGPTPKDCVEGEYVYVIIRACTALLMAGESDPVARGRYFVARANAFMHHDDIDPAAAIADYSEAIKVDPKNIVAIKGRAHSYVFVSEHEHAEADWSRAIELEPALDDNYQHRGLSRLALGHGEEALADFNKVIETNPKQLDAYIGRAKAYDLLNKRDLTLKEIDAALAIDGNYIPAYVARGEAADRWGNVELAVDSYAHALKLNGMNLKVRQALQRLGVFTPAN